MAAVQKIVIHFKGGIVSPGFLKQVLTIAASANVKQVRFGLRQELLIDVPYAGLATFSKHCKGAFIKYFLKKQATPNIVSSYMTADLFSSESWLREGVFKDIFDSFNYEPQLKINICESTQQLVPLLTGQLNWIASPTPHFWYLYVHLPAQPNAFCWKDLVYTNDIAAVSRLLELLIINGAATEEALCTQAQNVLQYNNRQIDQKLQLASFSLPYYEGFNLQSNHTWWLGIYRRDEFFSIAFLLDVCDICMQTKIGELYTTPWKSLIIKSIDKQYRRQWDKILGKHQINVRHAANELNWQVDDDEGLMLKRLVIRHFDKEDVRTYGLCFAVHTKVSSNLFGSIIISKEALKGHQKAKVFNRYSIFYKQDFNPNASNKILFRNGIKKEYLGIYIASLCKTFYEQLDLDYEEQAFEPVEELNDEIVRRSVYQCKYCLSIYDELAGDEGQEILPGTPFSQLPKTFRCCICDSDIEAFSEINAQLFLTD